MSSRSRQVYGGGERASHTELGLIGNECLSESTVLSSSTSENQFTMIQLIGEGKYSNTERIPLNPSLNEP
ncbi:hypothetical protein TNCV_4981761 [Trichonephila clavipes]|nr:hypothetical protein TNCV_4981761 [Trichonephila clavipes]